MNQGRQITSHRSGKIRAIYDISALGLGMAKPIFRTGIHRVVENLASALLKSDSVAMEWAACKLPGLTAAYYRRHPFISKAPLSVPGGRLAASRAATRLCGADSGRLGGGGWVSQGAWLAYVLMSESASLLLPSIPSEALGEAQVIHFPFPFVSIPREVRKSGRLQVFFTLYDLIPLLYPQCVGKRFRERLTRSIAEIKQSDWILCISNSTRNDLLNYRKDIDPSRVFVTHLAASSQFARVAPGTVADAVKRRYGIPDGPYVLSLCSLAPHKNLAHVIRSFCRMVQQERGREVNLVLAGTRGWLYSETFSTIEEAKDLASRIIVTGYVEDGDLAPLYSGADAFVFMSRYEGFGLPCLEAMSCGTPVIASNTSSMPEVVGDTGILLNPDDADGLSQSMLKLLEDGELRERLSRRSLARASQFSWPKCASETIAAYETAASRAG